MRSTWRKFRCSGQGRSGRVVHEPGGIVSSSFWHELENLLLRHHLGGAVSHAFDPVGILGLGGAVNDSRAK